MQKANNMDNIEKLQQWYASQCNGDWEHSYGVHIDTLDNPGWRVAITIEDTDLEEVTMPQIEQDAGDSDWVRCWIEDKKFQGVGDPTKLNFILAKFHELVQQNQPA